MLVGTGKREAQEESTYGYYAPVGTFLVAADTMTQSKASLQMEVKPPTRSRSASHPEADMGIAPFI